MGRNGKAQMSAGLFLEAQSRLVYPAMKEVDPELLKILIDDGSLRSDLIDDLREVFEDRIAVDLRKIYDKPANTVLVEEVVARDFVISLKRVLLVPGVSDSEDFHHSMNLSHVPLPLSCAYALLSKEENLPESFKEKNLFFWGTIFIGEAWNAGFFVGFLSWNPEWKRWGIVFRQFEPKYPGYIPFTDKDVAVCIPKLER